MDGDGAFGAISEFEKVDGSRSKFVNLNSLRSSCDCNLEELPFTIRVLLESALRK